jgi:hypothetical protein
MSGKILWPTAAEHELTNPKNGDDAEQDKRGCHHHITFE